MVATSDPARGPRAEETEAAEAWRQVGDDLRRIGSEAATLARLRWHRLRLGAREGAHGLVFGAWAGLAGATLTVVAAALFVIGLAGAITAAAGGAAWLGALVAGAVGLGAGFAGLRWLRANMRRSFAADVERRFRPDAVERRGP